MATKTASKNSNTNNKPEGNAKSQPELGGMPPHPKSVLKLQELLMAEAEFQASKDRRDNRRDSPVGQMKAEKMLKVKAEDQAGVWYSFTISMQEKGKLQRTDNDPQLNRVSE